MTPGTVSPAAIKPRHYATLRAATPIMVSAGMAAVFLMFCPACLRVVRAWSTGSGDLLPITKSLCLEVRSSFRTYPSDGQIIARLLTEQMYSAASWPDGQARPNARATLCPPNPNELLIAYS